MTTCFAGIDPGKTGGLAVFQRCRLRHVERLDFDKPGLIYDTLLFYGVSRVLIERAQAAPGQANQFEYGRAFGRAEAACLVAGVRLDYCSPDWWKSRLNVPKAKEGAYDLACRRFPGFRDMAPPGKLGGLDKVHGMAEAALIGSVFLDHELTADMERNNAARVRDMERRRSKPKFTWRGA